MTVTYSEHLDGGGWTQERAAVGALRTGPLGLVRLLESRLGLGGPEPHPAERIEAWMRRMQAVDEQVAGEPGSWFHDSFEADPWSTAATLLRLRDELIEAGWNAEIGYAASPRLEALCRLEASPTPELPPGPGDRLQAVFSELEALASELPETETETEIAETVLDLTVVTILDSLEHLPPSRRKLFALLERCGVAVDRAGDTVATRATRENSAVGPAGLAGPVGGAPVGAAPPRAEAELLTAGDEWEAADAVAAWLAAGTAAENESVTLVCAGDSSVLDAALRERGLPIVATPSASSRRGALQLLPLLLENAWRPVDVHRLAELLSLEYSPVPRGAARRFLTALTKEPGIGGRAWAAALEAIASERSEAEADRYHRLLAAERFDPAEGIPPEAVAERCRVAIERLAPRMEDDATAAAAVAHARVLRALCGASSESDGRGARGGREERADGGTQNRRGTPIPRPTLERMMDSVLGTGAVLNEHEREASPWRVVKHPGEVVDPSETVLWWNFTDPGVASTTHWSASERRALAAVGVELTLPETAHHREAAAWRRPAQAAAGRLIMVLPQRLRGEETAPHPWLDELAASMASMPERGSVPTRHAEELFSTAEFAFAGRRAELVAVTPRERRRGNGRYPISPHAIDHPHSLSYTSMDDLLGCPMRWALSRHARIAPSQTAEIPSGNTMLGTFCHRIVEQIYGDAGGRIAPEDAERRAAALFDDGVEAMASELLLPGREIEHRRARSMIAIAVRRLAEALERTGLTVEATEEFLEVPLNGGTLNGATLRDATLRGPADLIARDRTGRPFVIDLKWSGSSRYRREEIERGEALQLAVYTWMIRRRDAADAAGSTGAGSAYFMLVQGELLSASPLLMAEALESELTEQEVFERVLRGCEERVSQMNDGLLEATGVTKALRLEEEGIKEEKLAERLRSEHRERGVLYRTPPCPFCDYGRLCGLESDTV